MGPRIAARRVREIQTALPDKTTCFNGAAHRCAESVEVAAGERDRARRASMGPRIAARRVPAAIAVKLSTCARLQWGRASLRGECHAAQPA